LGVVWFHTIEDPALRDSGVLGRFSVAFYTIMAVLFAFEHAERNPTRGALSFAWGRVRRLYLPFLAWTALSLPVLFLVRPWDPGMPIPALDVNLLVSGATLPLWFIPFVVMATIVSFPLAKWAGKTRERELALLVASAAIAIGLDAAPFDAAPTVDLPVLGKAIELSWNRWSALWWGVALALAYRRWIKDSAWRSYVGLAGVSGTIVLVGMMWEFGPNPALKVLCGLCFSLLTLAPWRGPLVAFLGRYGRLSFGVYFAHMTVILVLRAAANHAGVSGCPERDLAIFLSTIFVCGVTLGALERFKPLKWMIA
jgi:fucose 4-O-acetylase-like acetyltransferase